MGRVYLKAEGCQGVWEEYFTLGAGGLAWKLMPGDGRREVRSGAERDGTLLPPDNPPKAFRNAKGGPLPPSPSRALPRNNTHSHIILFSIRAREKEREGGTPKCKRLWGVIGGLYRTLRFREVPAITAHLDGRRGAS
jgi:hypothetical protein